MEFFDACVRASKEFLESAGDFSHSELIQKSGVGEGGDLSMKADLLSEEIFFKYLSGYGKLYSEESGYMGSGKSIIYLDPLDGSDNFAARIPYYGASVCLVEESGKKLSFVVNFASKEVFYKEGDGETLFSSGLDKGSLEVFNGVEKPQIALFERAYSNPKIAVELFKKNIKFRSPGALALSLAYSQNALFALFLGKPRVFDIIAGLHLSQNLLSHNANGVLLTSRNAEVFEEILELATTIEGGCDVL